MEAKKLDEAESKDVLLSQVEVARRLNISVSTVKKYRLQGDLPFYKIGGLVKFKMKEVDAWIQAHQAQ